MGPNLSSEIFAILLRFRLYPTAIVSDITQAFLQLSLDEKDRDLTTFFWYKITQDSEGHYHTTDEFMTYRFTRLPFGLICSPFLLSAAVREQADRQRTHFPRQRHLQIVTRSWMVSQPVQRMTTRSPYTVN